MNCHVCELLDVIGNGKPYCGKTRTAIPAGQVSIPRRKARSIPGCTVPPLSSQTVLDEKFSLVSETRE